MLNNVMCYDSNGFLIIQMKMKISYELSLIILICFVVGFMGYSCLSDYYGCYRSVNKHSYNL